jgi:hypothetical protein
METPMTDAVVMRHSRPRRPTPRATKVHWYALPDEIKRLDTLTTKFDTEGDHTVSRSLVIRKGIEILEAIARKQRLTLPSSTRTMVRTFKSGIRLANAPAGDQR